ncbi:MAG: hypothetical protein H7281_03430 [Bacteriovorax sp.]|nr:hypothetical protein [Bacteriovorax sp.]
MESSLNERMGKLVLPLFKAVLVKLDSLDELVSPKLSPNRKNWFEQ